MTKYILIIYLLLVTPIYAEITADKLLFPLFKKEQISKDHIRYEINQEESLYNGLIFNLQIKDFDSEDLWTENNYEEEVLFSLNTRKKIASFLGLNEYQISSHFYRSGKLPMQIINGSFNKKKNEVTHFKEINLYNTNKLYQFKFYYKTPLADNDKIIIDLLNDFRAKLLEDNT